MPQLVRAGCAGVAVILIAALTSIGLYAVVAGGTPFGGAVQRPVTGGAQVLVTIQASQATPTPLSGSTLTPTPTAPIAAIAPPVTLTAVLPPAAPVVPAVGTAAPGQPSPVSTPPASTTPSPTSPVAAPPRPEAGQTAAHEGLTVEIVEAERGWQPTDASGAPVRIRSGHQLVTVLVRLTSSANDSRYVADGDLALVAEDGSRFAPRQDGPIREPRLLTMPILPGDTVRGWLTYETPSGLATRRLQWSPTRPDRPRADATYILGLPR